MYKSLFILLGLVGVAGCDRTGSMDSTTAPSQMMDTSATTNPTTKPDNTGMNTRDQDGGAVTAGGAGQSQSDVSLAANIRRQIMSGNLSTNAQNCKVIVQNGKVTLRGPVNSQAEKDQIGQIANAASGGAVNVDNELEVRTQP